MATLELGCGVHPTSGCLHHDRIKHADHVDIAWDLNIYPWPWKDEEFDKVIAIDVLEHTDPYVWLNEEKTLRKPPVQAWMDELWRILKPGGTAVLHLPAWNQPLSYRDPTHYRFFHVESLSYWQPGHYLHEQFGKFYFAESARWWNVELVEQVGNSDIGFVLRKLVF